MASTLPLSLFFSQQIMSNSVNPWIAVHQTFWSLTISRRLPTFMSIELGYFSKSCLFTSGGQNIGASASASVLPINIQGLISFRIDWFDLLAVQGTLERLHQDHNLKTLILWHSAFFMVQLSHLYVTLEKPLPRLYKLLSAMYYLCFLIWCPCWASLITQYAV